MKKIKESILKHLFEIADGVYAAKIRSWNANYIELISCQELVTII
jgi:hypothetical protein